MVKAQLNRGKEANVYFFRDCAGNEVDLLISQAGSLVSIEIKSAATFTRAFLDGIENFKKIAGIHDSSYVVYTGNSRTLDKFTTLINFKDVAKIVRP